MAGVKDVIEVSYTGDILAHRRCRRAWAYEKRAGFHPYEVVQAMEGRLVHHAMEWLTSQYQLKGRHASRLELAAQLEYYFRVLWARGIRTAFVSKATTIERVVDNLYPSGQIDSVVRAVVEGAQHTEYELRSVRRVLPADLGAFSGKSRILLTGILDLVIQQQEPLTYRRKWTWDSLRDLRGHIEEWETHAKAGDVEIWDYKGTKAHTPFVEDYVRQLLTYAALFRDRTGALPRRCVLFFINERQIGKRLLAIDVSDSLVERALQWTYDQVREIRATTEVFEADPTSVPAGELAKQDRPRGQRISAETKGQCTTCSQRFDCSEYSAHLSGGIQHPDIDVLNVYKN